MAMQDLVSIGEVCLVGDGAHAKLARQASGVPYFTAKNLKDGRLTLDDHFFISESDFSKHFPVTSRAVTRPLAGDVLINIIGSIGSPYAVRESGPFGVSSSVAILRPDPERVDQLFLYYWIQSSQFQAALLAIKGGVAQGYVSLGMLRSLPAPSIPISTQRQIAKTLSAYDDLIENNTRRIAILEEMAQRLYREWFVHFRYPGHESVPLLDSDLGPIPEGWEIKSFADLADYVNGYAFKPTDWRDCGTPIVKIAELKNGITESTPRYSGTELPDKFQVRDGDLLFSWSADLNAYLWNGGPALLNQHLFRVDPVTGMSRAWLLQALSHSMDEFRGLSLGTTMRHIKRSALSQVRLVVPSAAHISAYTSVVQPMHDELTVLARPQRVLRQARDMLLRKLIGG